MKKFLIILLLAMLGCSPAVVKETNTPVVKQKVAVIDWQPFDTSLFKVSQALGKPLFVYLTYDKCKYCKLMDKNTFSDPIIVKAINKQFIATKINVGKQMDVAQLFYSGTTISIPKIVIMQQKDGTLFTVEKGGYLNVFGMINVINKSQKALAKAVNENNTDNESTGKHKGIPAE